MSCPGLAFGHFLVCLFRFCCFCDDILSIVTPKCIKSVQRVKNAKESRTKYKLLLFMDTSRTSLKVEVTLNSDTCNYG